MKCKISCDFCSYPIVFLVTVYSRYTFYPTTLGVRNVTTFYLSKFDFIYFTLPLPPSLHPHTDQIWGRPWEHLGKRPQPTILAWESYRQTAPLLPCKGGHRGFSPGLQKLQLLMFIPPCIPELSHRGPATLGKCCTGLGSWLLLLLRSSNLCCLPSLCLLNCLWPSHFSPSLSSFVRLPPSCVTSSL